MEEMDSAGVDKAILTGRQSGHRIVSNDDIAELRNRYPGQFPVALAGISVANVSEALSEIDRTVVGMDFRGIEISPGSESKPVYVDDLSIYPIYARCQELGVPLYLVCGVMQGPNISYAEPWRIQHVAADFPDLQIVVVHAAFPFSNEMIGVMIRNSELGNLWVMIDFLYYTPGLPGVNMWLNAINHYLSDRVIYSSAYPLTPLAQALDSVKRFSYQPGVLNKLLCDNATKLFGPP
ncbi:amidohydrolase family protein [Chloroflexota bacterium]